jgi:beta-1,4-mannosyl-glycoprotein beta-1,4-N-acetylglucosaminyltransferase
MKIIDSFIFYNELVMLEYRLNLLYQVVDYFIIVESTHTFMGNEKKLYFQENKERFKDFEDKIIHIIIDDFPFKQPNINIKNNEQWENENFQRKQIEKGIKQIDMKSNDIIIVSDLDEIPNPLLLKKIREKKISVGIVRLEMDFYYYNLYSKFEDKWDKAIMFTYFKQQKYKFDYNFPRNDIEAGSIKNGGWHLSYFGDSNFISNKLKEFSHQEFNNENFTSSKIIQDRIENNKDLFNRKTNMKHIPLDKNNNLPPKYDIYLKDFY